ncbi:MAG: cytidine deaminase [Sphingomonadales bacterium]|nr:cytidine deaminase [Sphingomonadales bacterium]
MDGQSDFSVNIQRNCVVRGFHLETLDRYIQELIHEAEQALSTAYAPYSRFFVGVALLLENGKVIPGSNQENAAYPSGLCAERTALFAAGVQEPGVPVMAMAIVVARSDGTELSPAFPCGSCLQVLLEVERRQKSPVRVYLKGTGQQVYEADGVSVFLPFGFDSSFITEP